MNIFESILSFLSSSRVYGVIITLFIATLLNRLISNLLEKRISKGKTSYETKKRKTITKLFQNISKYIIIIIALLAILSIYGVNIQGLITGLGLTATILGLALQDTFKDIINGINIILENYFIVGDIVEYNSFTGEIFEFGLKSTKIKNSRGEVLIVANRNIMEIKNLSQQEQKIVIEIPVSYESEVVNVENVINKNILPKIKKITNVNKETVNYLGINKLADSSVNYMIEFKCQREKHWQAKRDANKIILQEMTANNISIPYSQLEVHINGK